MLLEILDVTGHTITIPEAELGNSATHNVKVLVKRTRDGGLWTYLQREDESQNMTVILDDTQYDELMNFFRLIQDNFVRITATFGTFTGRLSIESKRQVGARRASCGTTNREFNTVTLILHAPIQ